MSAKKKKIEKEPPSNKITDEVKSRGGIKKTQSKASLSKKTLVIVESPAKAKTINKYLGNDYVIEASLGHIIDLPKSRMAVDALHDFQPEYITVRGRAKVLNKLKNIAGCVSGVLLAADPDREGEAISWHLKNALMTKNANIKRIEFNEITKRALQEAITKPREIDLNLVNAQQARRVLDRLVGYNISPILWKKVKRGLSAGRVQSIALKYICERELEIDKFIEEEYWSLSALLSFSKVSFKAELHSINGVKQDKQIKSEAEMTSLSHSLEKENFVVKTLSSYERKREPTAPYTTSKLQQDASSRLGYSSQKTMMLAQQLYEGIELGKLGFTGLITYMRTDSNRVSPDALSQVREYIRKEYGEKYLSPDIRNYKNKSGAQDAHEAVRPTDPSRHPNQVLHFLNKDQFRLYQMIWQKFVSSQMTSEVSLYTTAEIQAGRALFRSTQRRIVFDGFGHIFDKENMQERANKENEESIEPSDSSILSKLQEGMELKLKKFDPKQHFTQPPSRYSDATMVKILEESGVGRPSTYAPTIQTLIKRYYVTRFSGRSLKPSELGFIVNRIMSKHFSVLVDEKFTANMENELDKIAEARLDWVKMLHTFYEPFAKTVVEAAENIEDMKSAMDVPTEHVCEKCGTHMVKRLGRNGYFLACPKFPECRNAKSIPLGPCSVCSEGSTVKRATKKGRPFYGCSRYPDCEFSTWETPSEEICPDCNKLLFQKSAKKNNPELHCLHCNYKTSELEKVLTL